MIKKRVALYPGSFDPFTNGHLNTVERASLLFDEVIIGIFTNTSKKPLFNGIEKQRLTEEATKHLSNVSVITQSEGLTVDIAKSLGANFLIRGVRDSLDFEYEKNIGAMNRKMSPDIDTIYLIAAEEYSNINSSMIKEIAKFNGDVSSFVPNNINEALKRKFS